MRNVGMAPLYDATFFPELDLKTKLYRKLLLINLTKADMIVKFNLILL